MRCLQSPRDSINYRKLANNHNNLPLINLLYALDELDLKKITTENLKNYSIRLSECEQQLFFGSLLLRYVQVGHAISKSFGANFLKWK